MSDEFDLSSEEEVPAPTEFLSSLLSGFAPSPEMTTNIPLERGTSGSAGYDFKSLVSVNIAPHSTVLVNTGVRLSIPAGYYMQLYTRSSIALRGKTISSSGIISTNHSVTVLAGVIDSDYTGEIMVALHNLSDTNHFVVNVDDKIAQGIIHKYHTFANEIIVKDSSFVHEGFGSTTL